jgi:hypothetical protein
MHDRDVRAALMGDLYRLHGSDPGALILHEFAVSGGAVRLDIAVVNGSLDGFEIKSASDTLQRLPLQADAYSRVLEFVTIVAAANHVERVLSMVPKWWTVSLAEPADGEVRIGPVRTGRRNAEYDAVEVARLLWRDEALAVLRARGLAKGLLSRPRIEIYEALARNMHADDLLKEVRSALKGRTNWRNMFERGVRRPRPSRRLKLGDVPDYPRKVVIRSYLTPGCRVAGSFLTPRAPIDEPVSRTERRAGEVRSCN